MSSTYTINGSLTQNNVQLVQASKSFTTTGEQVSRTRKLIVSSGESTIAVPTHFTAQRDLIIKNEDDTNYIEVGVVSGARTQKIYPGQVFMTCINASVYVKADTDDCYATIVQVDTG